MDDTQTQIITPNIPDSHPIFEESMIALYPRSSKTLFQKYISNNNVCLFENNVGKNQHIFNNKPKYILHDSHYPFFCHGEGALINAFTPFETFSSIFQSKVLKSTLLDAYNTMRAASNKATSNHDRDDCILHTCPFDFISTIFLLFVFPSQSNTNGNINFTSNPMLYRDILQDVKDFIYQSLSDENIQVKDNFLQNSFSFSKHQDAFLDFMRTKPYFPDSIFSTWESNS